MTTPDRLKLVLYGRVSTTGQLDGYGPEIQTKALRGWMKDHGHTTVGEILFDGGVSGTVDADDRPKLAQAINLIAAGKADGIVVPMLDRLARELTIQEATLMVVWAHGGRVFAVDHGEVDPDDENDPMRTFVRQVMGAAAQLERGLIVKRLKGGLATKKAAGGYAGGAPAFGMRAVGKELCPDEDEQLVVTRIKALRDRGLSLRQIADRLNDDGVPTKRGGLWQAYTVARIVNPAARKADAERAVDRYAQVKASKKLSKANKVMGKVS